MERVVSSVTFWSLNLLKDDKHCGPVKCDCNFSHYHTYFYKLTENIWIVNTSFYIERLIYVVWKFDKKNIFVVIKHLYYYLNQEYLQESYSLFKLVCCSALNSSVGKKNNTNYTWEDNNYPKNKNLSKREYPRGKTVIRITHEGKSWG